MSYQVLNRYGNSYPRRQWIEYGSNELVTAEAVDLLDKLLRYDHAERLTAHEAQAHVYFSELTVSTIQSTR